MGPGLAATGRGGGVGGWRPSGPAGLAGPNGRGARLGWRGCGAGLRCWAAGKEMAMGPKVQEERERGIFPFSFSKQIFQKHFKYKFQLDFELIWNSNQNHSSQNKYATACMHHLQLTLYLILVFTKIIYFLYFNAHQNCLNKSIWLFLENENFGCYRNIFQHLLFFMLTK